MYLCGTDGTRGLDASPSFMAGVDRLSIAAEKYEAHDLLLSYHHHLIFTFIIQRWPKNLLFKPLLLLQSLFSMRHAILI